MDSPRILFLDIETRIMEVYSFGIRDQYLTHKQIKHVKDGRNIHCIGLKWRGDRSVTVLNEWEHGYEGMLEGVHKVLSEADAVATYNGASFDIPKIWGQFAIAGMKPPPPPTQIDIFKTARKLGFPSSKLDYIAPIFGLGGKIKHDGIDMWIAALGGCEKAQRKMIRYCAGDVRLTEQVYDALLPYITAHPHMGFRSPAACPSCGEKQMQRRGVRRNKATFVERLQCQNCGSWTAGKTTRVAKTLAAMEAS